MSQGLTGGFSTGNQTAKQSIKQDINQSNNQNQQSINKSFNLSPVAVNATYCSSTYGTTTEHPFTSRSSLFDACSLYTYILSWPVPYDKYKIFDTNRNRKAFEFYSEKIKRFDTGYFALQTQLKNEMFFVVAQIDYDLASAKNLTIDLSALPTKQQVTPDQLSKMQTHSLTQQRKNIPTNTRLISSCDPGQTADYLENIFMSALFLGAKIVKIEKIITCRAFPIFQPYINRLSRARATEKSSILNRVVKTLSNALAGKFHQVINNQ